MNKILTTILAGTALFGLTGAASAAPWVIDFDTKPGGGTFADDTIFGDRYGTNYQRYEGSNTIPGSNNVNVNISANAYGGADLAVGYASGGSIGRDKDLEEGSSSRYPSFGFNAQGTELDGSPVANSGYGNIAIVQEVGCGSGQTCSDADDEADGGWLKFDFGTAVTLLGMNVFDIEPNCYGVSKVYFDTDGDNEYEVSMNLPIVGDRGVTFMTFNGTEGILANKMKVKFKESGAIDNITGNTPGGGGQVSEPASLALFGIGLAAMGVYRRRRRA